MKAVTPGRSLRKKEEGRARGASLTEEHAHAHAAPAARISGRTQNQGVVSLIAAALFLMMPGSGLAQEEVVLGKGKQEYLAYCANCHGLQGKGNGPLSMLLTVVPADLTQLRKANKGEFPFWRVYKIIDGRDIVRGHGARNMPIWGAEFLTEEGGGYLDEDRVIGRILGLVYYLQSIQEQ